MGLLSAGSVVRLDPLTGGLRPFVEGQFGLAASLVDRRSMDLDGIRTSHAITSFDPTAYYGWSAGTRIRVGRGTFLSFRYGETQGGQLDRHSTAEPEGVPTPLDPRRRAVMVGFSFGR